MWWFKVLRRQTAPVTLMFLYNVARQTICGICPWNVWLRRRSPPMPPRRNAYAWALTIANGRHAAGCLTAVFNMSILASACYGVCSTRIHSAHGRTNLWFKNLLLPLKIQDIKCYSTQNHHLFTISSMRRFTHGALSASCLLYTSPSPRD